MPIRPGQAKNDIYLGTNSASANRFDSLSMTYAKNARQLPINIPPGGSITFVTRRLPYGFAFPEVPSTHLFAYPDLGISIINGFSAEQPKARGVGVAVLVDPGVPKAADIEAAERLLLPRRMLVRTY